MTTLPRPRTLAGAVGLQVVLADLDKAAVAVDFDGTLAPIVERPEDARPAPGAVEALAALCRSAAGAAVVTGRDAEEAVRLAGLEDVSGLVVYGHYGLQRWSGGRLEAPEPVAEIEQARVLLRVLVTSGPQGMHLEDKQHSLAIHTRPAADPAGALEAVLPQVSQIAGHLGLDVVPGRYVVEVRPAGSDKGLAVRRLVEESAATAVVYVGDDLGDLPAYDAVDALREGGVVGLTVASVSGSDAPPELAARADLVLDGPDAVVGFLRNLVPATKASPS